MAVARDRDRKSLARQGGLVEHGLAACHGAVGGDDLTCADRDEVSDHERFDLDLLERLADVAVRGTWRALDEESELSAGASVRPGLERCPARHHQRDDRGSEELPERERPDDRDERDRVDPDVAAEQRARR